MGTCHLFPLVTYTVECRRDVSSGDGLWWVRALEVLARFGDEIVVGRRGMYGREGGGVGQLLRI